MTKQLGSQPVYAIPAYMNHAVTRLRDSYRGQTTWTMSRPTYV